MKKKNEEDHARVDDTQYAAPLAIAATLDAGSGQITVADLDNLRHMLGVSDRCRRGYRNHFVAGGSDVNSMERLRAAGFVVKNERIHSDLTGGMPCYHATIDGARAIGLRSLATVISEALPAAEEGQ